MSAVTGTVAFGADVGGSSIKFAPVDLRSGQLLAELGSVPTPAMAEGLIAALAQLAETQPVGTPLGVALPSVVRRGVIYTAANLAARDTLIGMDAGQVLGQRLARPVALLNDADAAGVAEMRAGAAHGVAGTVMLLTFGTGIGSALFIDGELVPNTELGHMEVGGVEAELRASARVRREENLDWPAWAGRVNQYLDALNRLFWPELIVIGGGVSEHFDLFGPLLRSRAEVRVAHFGPAAGVVGAAFAAAGPGS